MRKIVCRQPREALLCNGGIAESGLQMPHVHILPVTPLGTCDMAQAGADEHQGRVAIGEGTHDPGAPADLAVQAFHDVVRANPRPVFGWEIAVGPSQILCKLQMKREQIRIQCARQRIYPTAALCAV